MENEDFKDQEQLLPPGAESFMTLEDLAKEFPSGSASAKNTFFTSQWGTDSDLDTD